MNKETKICQNCQNQFVIEPEDFTFYVKIQVPPPTFCPECRLQRRLGWRINFLPIFYKKICSASGHNEKIISFYSDKNPIKVFDDEYYISDKWDALEFGKNYDFSKLFFEQFNELELIVPHQSLQNRTSNVQCNYVVSGASSKNCYYTTIPYHSENIYYAYLPIYSRDSVDVNTISKCELCYESVNIENCYNCNFCYDSINCLDSYFLYDCRNCQNCFGCANLRNKQYCFFNQQFTKEEYQKKMKEINLGKKSVLREYQTKFKKILSLAIRKNIINVKTENVFGNDIRESRNCFYSFLVIGGSENLRYCFSVDKTSDSMDFYGGANSSLVYESTGIIFSSQIKFSYFIVNSLELEYCVECSNCQYCFGCVGLKNRKYCIFNKQYSQDEYWRIIDGIKTQMSENSEYGEFFPLNQSPFPYQDSGASIEFPLTKEEIIKRGWHWQEEVKSEIDLAKFAVLKFKEVPDDISDIDDNILDVVIICEQTGKPFRIVKFELDFYRKKNLPIPTIHPLQRIRNRFDFRHSFRLWQYPCSKCGQEMYSGWDSEKKFKVYCEACYISEVV